MDNKIFDLFNSNLGKKIYSTIEKTVFEHNMLERIKSGVLVGFSGGADSVILLSYLFTLRKQIGDFPLLAVHVNHMIRGAEADRDEEFSKLFAESLNITFISKKINIPEIAENDGLSIEEAARNARYSFFDEIISSRNGVSCIAVAHNATDNIETTIFNMLRGSGTKGVAGIPPIRDNIIRPLIEVSKLDIVELLDSCSIEYVTDSSNLEDEYSRNYIRKNILPTLRNISLNPENSFSRLSHNLRLDDEYISMEADRFVEERSEIPTKELASLHKALLYRVLAKMVSPFSVTLEFKHIEIISSLLSSGDFEVSLPGGLRFVSERGVSYITDKLPKDENYLIQLNIGENVIKEYGAFFHLTNEKIDKTSLKVYKKSIQADISSAIIVGRLFIRPKRDGDTVFYNGMTHKLKKLYNDKKIPKSKRPLIPVLCDEKGIVWVPGFGVRDDMPECKKRYLYATLAIDDSSANSSTFYIV